MPRLQEDMRRGYFGGAPGVLISGLVWSTAATVTMLNGNEAGILTLFIGGMFIFPLSIALCKILGRVGGHHAGNPLGTSAAEGTIFFLACLPAAFATSRAHMDWFYPAMLAIIGGRYVTFQSLYGTRLYWILGGMLILAASLILVVRPAIELGAVTGAVIELIFAIVLFWTARSDALRQRQSDDPQAS
jgi:hypothetical protein